MKLFTIGFTRKIAEAFFTHLTDSGASCLTDARLNNVSQLAGFAKRDDLRFFARSLCGMDYVHLLDLAPTSDILDQYKKRQSDWLTYEKQFLELMESRRVESALSPALLDNACLLCSEEKPHYCHRRLAAEYLSRHWPGMEIVHVG